MPRGSDQLPGIQYQCNVPEKTLLIDRAGDCWICSCEAWLPVSVGNIMDFTELRQVWSNSVAQELQQDIQEGKFTYCAVQHCGIVNHDILFNRYNIHINIDESCNLACPSCRKNLIHHKSEEVYDRMQMQVLHIVKLLEKFTEPMNIIMSGNGDPLASLVMRPLFLNWEPTTNQNIRMFTNGLLLKKMLPGSTVWPSISEFKISVDAGTAEVYEKVRKPGKFWVLEENLDWLSRNRGPGVDVELQFCISATNAEDIINYARLCEHYGFRGHLSKIVDWATFDDFNSQDVVGNIHHEKHHIVLSQLHEISELPYINLQNTLMDLL